MSQQLTINLSEETYEGLMNLVGEKNADQFIEATLRDKLKEQTEFFVAIPRNTGENKAYIRSPHLVNRADLELLKVELIEE